MISVIIPVYNVSAFLPRCLDSVLRQPFLREILLVDDGSTDDSGKICDQYAGFDSRITVIHKENGGLSSARNAGLDRATGEYVAFVDSDDFLEPDAYGILLNAAREQSCDLVCAGRYDLEEATGRKTPGLCPEREAVISGQELVKRIFTWQGVDSAAWDKLYRRSLFEGIRYPEGMICEDVPVTYRLALRAGRIAMVPRCLYTYCHRPNSITTTAVSEKSFHFCRHAEGICRDIAGKAPELLPQARSLYVWSLAHPMLLFLENGRDSGLQALYRENLRKLRRQTPFFLRSPLISGKQKRQYLLLVLGLFGPLWHLRAALHPTDRMTT